MRFSQQCQRPTVNWYMVASTLEKHSAPVFRAKWSIFLDYLTLKLEELYSSIILITVYQLTQCHITEGLNLHKFYVSNLYNIFIIFVVLCICCTMCILLFVLQMPDCWLEVSSRKVLRPATSTQVFLGFPVSTSEC